MYDIDESLTLTVKEVAALLHCCKAHVFNLVHGKVQGARPFPHVKVGRKIIFRRKSVMEWIETCELR